MVAHWPGLLGAASQVNLSPGEEWHSMHKAEALPAATQARHGASWASGQLPAVGGAGVGMHAQSYSLPVQLPLCGTHWL